MSVLVMGAGTAGASTVDSAAITDGSIVDADVNSAAAVAISKLAAIGTLTLLGNNTGGTSVPLALTAAQAKTLLAIASGDVSGLGALATLSAVGSAQITDASITGTDIAATTITGANIANATITTTQISGTAGITGAQIAATTIAAGNIVANTITATQIANATITDTQVAAANKDGTAGTASMRTLGSAATQAAPGTGSAVYAPLASPTFTGTVAAATITATGVVTGVGLVTTGGLTTTTVTKAANYTATTADHIILVDSTAAARTITLPTAVGVTGQEYVVKDWKGQAATNNITVATTGGQTIDGAANKVISTNYTSLTLVSDGANWSVV